MSDMEGQVVEVLVSDPWEWGTEVGVGPFGAEVIRICEDENGHIKMLLARLVAPVQYEGQVCQILLVVRRLAGQELTSILGGEEVPCAMYHVPTEQAMPLDAFNIDDWLGNRRGGIGLIGSIRLPSQ